MVASAWLTNGVAVARWLANFAIGVVVVVVTLVFVESLSIAYFKFTGQITEGQPTYFELRTPTWEGLILFQAACVAVVATALVFRKLLRGNRKRRSE